MADNKDKEKSMFTKAKEALLGTPEQNAKAAAEMKEQDKKKPDSTQAKINKMTNYGGYKKGGCVKMSKGGSASSRADGCAVKGKTRGKMV
jgi:hypothetical protein